MKEPRSTVSNESITSHSKMVRNRECNAFWTALKRKLLERAAAKDLVARGILQHVTGTGGDVVFFGHVDAFTATNKVIKSQIRNANLQVETFFPSSCVFLFLTIKSYIKCDLFVTPSTVSSKAHVTDFKNIRMLGIQDLPACSNKSSLKPLICSEMMKNPIREYERADKF
uniref:Uncharacterized protein n=1 Tax=Romanomermis culicivorax TaxID=13658 RepID=A0A915IJQ7_ROMCU